MFLKLKKLMGQSDLQVDERDGTEVAEPMAQPRMASEKVNAPEYLQTLLKENEPTQLLTHITELVNNNIPEFLKKCIDKDAEKSHIYEHLSGPFNEYIRFVVNKVYADANGEAVAATTALELQVTALTDRIREIDHEKNEIQKLQLSSERQKRTYSERVHELEARIMQFENGKTALEEERRGLRDRVKKAEEQEVLLRNSIEQLRSEQTVWEEKAAGYDQRMAEYTERENELRQMVESATQAFQDAQAVLDSVRIHEQELQEKLMLSETDRELYQSQVGGLNEHIEVLRLRVEELQTEREAGISGLEAVRDELKATLEREQFLQALQSESEDIQAKQQKQIEVLNGLSDELRVQVQLLTGERQVALENCTEAENRLKEISESEASLKDEVNRHVAERDAAELQVQELSARLEDSDRLLKDAILRSETLEVEEKRQKEQNDEVVRNLQMAGKNEAVLKKRIEELETFNIALEQQILDLTAEQQAQQQQWSEAETAWQAASEREQAMQASLKAAKAERAELAATLDEIKQNSEQADADRKEQLEKALSQAETTSLKLEEMEAEREKLTARLEQSERNCADLINRMAGQNATFETAQRERTEADREEKAKLGADLKALSESHSNLEKQLEAERTAKNALEAKLRDVEGAAHDNQERESETVKQLKHELLVAGDMLAALKNQRQTLLSDVEKAHNEQSGLRQYVAGLEESVKQYDETVKEYQKEIEALKNSQIAAGEPPIAKPAGKVSKKEIPAGDGTDDWLVPTRPDTPEMIAKRKAEKKAKELPEEPEKPDAKPDLSQMSLW